MIATIAGTRRVQVARERRHFTAEQKLSILRKHLLEGAAIADVCDQQGLTPGLFYRWQKELFENGAAVLQVKRRPTREKHLERQLQALEKKLAHKDEVVWLNACARVAVHLLATGASATGRLQSTDTGRGRAIQHPNQRSVADMLPVEPGRRLRCGDHGPSLRLRSETWQGRPSPRFTRRDPARGVSGADGTQPVSACEGHQRARLADQSDRAWQTGLCRGQDNARGSRSHRPSRGCGGN